MAEKRDRDMKLSLQLREPVNVLHDALGQMFAHNYRYLVEELTDYPHDHILWNVIYEGMPSRDLFSLGDTPILNLRSYFGDIRDSVAYRGGLEEAVYECL